MEQAGDDTKKFDDLVKMRNEFLQDCLEENGIKEDVNNFAAYHYFIGSGLEVDDDHPFDTENGVIMKAIRTVSKYL